MQPEDSSDRVRCRLTAEVVRRFGVARFRVTGTSMLPSVWPGDLVTVQERTLAQVRIGEIVLFTRQDRLFAHRVVGKRARVLITRGDSHFENDPPVTDRELLGSVTDIQRGRRHFQPPRRLNRWGQVSAAILRSSWLLRRLMPSLVTAWNA